MVYLLLADGFEEVEALAPLDLLRRAEIDARTVSAASDRMVRGAHGIAVECDLCLSALNLQEEEPPELLMLPGGMPGTANLDASPQVHALLDRALDGGSFIAAICAAPMILGKRRLLEGHRATCFPGFEQYLPGAQCTGARVERSGKFITGRDMGAALDFGAALIDALRGEEAAAEWYAFIHKK